MLYYRMRKSVNTRLFIFNAILLMIILFVWYFWMIGEIPFWKKVYSSSTISKGSIIISTSSASSDIESLSTGFTEPAVGVLTSSYGERWGRFHEGIDIGGNHGSNIVAADSGVVKLSQWVSGYGNYIEIEHPNGFVTAYGHCDKLLVSEGDSVSQGQTIATMGSTGNSTGPHLHFEVLLEGEPQNPLDYVIY